MKAWIVKWSWVGDHVAVEHPVVAVLSARLSPNSVRRIVELHYLIASSTLAEHLAFARYNNPAPMPYPAEFERIEGVVWEGGVITCGHNPFLEAFKADNVKIASNEFGLSWRAEATRERRDLIRAQILQSRID